MVWINKCVVWWALHLFWFLWCQVSERFPSAVFGCKASFKSSLLLHSLERPTVGILIMRTLNPTFMINLRGPWRCSKRCSKHAVMFNIVWLSATSTSRSICNYAFGIALGYGLDGWGSKVRFPAGAWSFSLHHRVQNGSEAHLASYSMGTRGSLPGNKAAWAWS
jgi:hypothetical protein